MSKGEFSQDLGDLIVIAAASGIDSDELKKMVEVVSDDLSWKAPEGPARMGGGIFVNAAYSCKGDEMLMQQMAESYTEMFGIPTQEAVRRIKLAGKRS